LLQREFTHLLKFSVLRLTDIRHIEEALKKKLENIKLVIAKKVGANGSLFGAITNHDVADTLKTQGVEIDKKLIHLDSAIKATGIYEADVKLGHGIHAKLKFEVVGE